MKTAVVLFSMGGPASLKEIQPFLFHLFNDPAILRMKQPWRKGLAFFLSHTRKAKARAIYEKLGGSSPLLQNTQDQAKALERLLQKDGAYQCYVAMSYAPPFIQDVFEEIEKTNPSQIILLPLYPQYSTTTTNSVLQAAYAAIKKWKKKPLLGAITSFQTEAGFIGAICEIIKPIYEKAKAFGDPLLLFSAHGLPEKIVKAGDDYPLHCAQTVSALAEKLNLSKESYVLCYQSRVGPMKWIGPSTETEIDRAAKQNRPLLVVPIAFVSEHSETLVEIGMDYKKRAENGGCPFFASVPTVQCHPLFIEGLATLVKSC